MKRGTVVLAVLCFVLRKPGNVEVVEVQDFVRFLKEYYGHERTVDESDAWSEEDLRDLTAAVLNHADRTV